MAGDSGAWGAGPKLRVHVWALPDCSGTPCDAQGRGGLGETAADDVTRMGRALSDPRRPLTSVTELQAGPN